MISAEVLRNILSAAILAPSGENSQPWRFKIKGDSIELWNNQESDLSYYNFNQYGSYVAHGAALENILLTASLVGVGVHVELFPSDDDKDFIARVIFREGDVQSGDLGKYIEKRVTNRKPYSGEPLLEQEADALKIAGSLYDGAFFLEGDKDEIWKLAQAGSVNEVVMLKNHFVHNFFFTHVRWSEEEDRKMPNGFYIKTLELLPPQIFGFRLFSRWWLLHILNKIGIPYAVAKENARVYEAASAFGIITIPKYEPRLFVEAGRKLQRVWLTATKLGLWMQPISGALFLINNLLLGEPENFSSEEADVLKRAHAEIRQVFNLEGDDVIVMMFRIGRGDPPSAHSSRFPLDSFIIKE